MQKWIFTPKEQKKSIHQEEVGVFKENAHFLIKTFLLCTSVAQMILTFASEIRRNTSEGNKNSDMLVQQHTTSRQKTIWSYI